MKPKREITLGEMQDECKTRIKCCTGCPYREVCGEIPKLLDLTDPPRFTEAQMALLKALYEAGARTIVHNKDGEFPLDESGKPIHPRFVPVGETLDLAELFGKEGADAK